MHLTSDLKPRIRFTSPKTSGLFLAVCSVALLSMGVAAAQSSDPVPTKPIIFDIPAQSLDQALDRFGASSHLEVLYETSVATGRRSTAVRGVYTPVVALRLLLSGSGLDFDYMGDGAFTLVPAAPIAAPPADRQEVDINGFNHFLGGVQAGILYAMCSDPVAHPGNFRMVLRLRIDASGDIDQPILLSSTGNSTRDAAIVNVLRHLSFTEAPPVNMPQPITLVMKPGPADRGECVGAGN